MSIFDYFPSLIEIIILIAVAFIFLPLAIYALAANIIDYRISKRFHTKKQKWDLNICCGNIDGGGMNADVVKRDLPNFVLVKNMYRLPFKNLEFENSIC